MGTDIIKKHIPAQVLLTMFICISLWFINDPLKTSGPEYRSAELKQLITKDGNVTRTDYFDDDGNPQIAANTGYATKLTIQQDNRETEIYLDERGERIKRYSYYYGILREYDEAGNNIRVTYLDEDNNPTATPFRYTTEEKKFNEYGQHMSSRFLDAEGKPAFSYDSGYGFRYEYDEQGHRTGITFLDATGEPMVLPAGYSSLVQEYYETNGPENGKVKKEFYYLPDGKPVSLALGQYGIYKEYDENGQPSLVTYLRDDGFPTVTSKGYTSVAYTYYADNSIKSTLYYDIDGNPFRLNEGQYGTKDENGQIAYLNADGTEQFNIKNFVYKNSRFVIAAAIALAALSAALGKKMNWAILIIYIAVIMYFTLMYREAGKQRIGVFYSYSRFFSNAGARAGILRNIWLFVPFGAILYRLCPRKTVLFVSVLLSVVIEAAQYFKGTGLCELDDVISNALGGAAGFEIGTIAQIIKRKIRRKKESGLVNSQD